jgi:hypothetical protein
MTLFELTQKYNKAKLLRKQSGTTTTDLQIKRHMLTPPMMDKYLAMHGYELERLYDEDTNFDPYDWDDTVYKLKRYRLNRILDMCYRRNARRFDALMVLKPHIQAHMCRLRNEKYVEDYVI